MSIVIPRTPNKSGNRSLRIDNFQLLMSHRSKKLKIKKDMPHSIAFTFHQKYWLKFCVIKKNNWGHKKTQVQIIARQVFTTKYTKWPKKNEILILAKLLWLLTLPLGPPNCTKQQKNPRELDVQLLREPFENTESFGTSYHTTTKMRKDKISEA